jgi:hypothetical protein
MTAEPVTIENYSAGRVLRGSDSRSAAAADQRIGASAHLAGTSSCSGSRRSFN